MTTAPATATETSIEFMRKEMLGDFIARRETLARLIDTSHGATIESHGWILVCDGLGIAFDVATKPNADGLRDVSNSRVKPVETCNRLTKSDALRLAPFIKNGKGTPARATHWRDAVATEIAECDTLIARLS